MEHSWIHDAIDGFSLLIGIIGLLVAFIDPTQQTKRNKIVKISALVGIVILLLVAGREWSVFRNERQAYNARVAQKRRQVVSELCKQPEMTFEQLYYDTSLGYADTELNDAIDDLTQDFQRLKVREETIKASDSPTKTELRIRLYHLDNPVDACEDVKKHLF